MHKCENIEPKLIFYFYEELSETEKLQVEEHLQNCPKCLQSYKKISTGLSVVEVEKKQAVNPFIATRVLQEISEKRSKQVTVRRFLQPALATAAVVTGIMFGVYFGSMYQTENNYQSNTYQEEYYFNDIQQDPFLSYALEE